MCTATWLSAGEELSFLFNRDERRLRPRGLPPRVAESGGVRYLAPVDAAAGGTWIAVNEYGLVFALLNRTEEGTVPGSGTTSRGSVIPALVEFPDAKSSNKGLTALNLRQCAPFRLLVRDPRSRAMFCGAWNGTTLDSVELAADAGLLCSSSLGDARVTRARTPQWERLFEKDRPPRIEELRDFQRSHEPEPSAESVCMHRHDAETVSHVEIRIASGLATMSYVDGSPCRNAVSAVETLALSR